MAEQVKKTEQVEKAAPQKMRSPDHPAISLPEAIKKAEDFYRHEGFNYAPADVAKLHWGYGPKSSSGMRLLAALIHYGLLEESGAGGQRRVRLTSLGKAILIDKREDTTERDAALRRAALNPSIYSRLWKFWGGALPSDRNMEFELIQQFKFNPDSVRSFIKDFKATVAFANLAQSSKSDAEDDSSITVDDLPKAESQPALTNRPILPQGGVMPQIQHDTVQMPPLDLTIPLGGGRRAVLRMPESLSASEFNLIVTMLKLNLHTMKPVLVGAQPDASSPESNNAEEKETDWPQA